MGLMVMNKSFSSYLGGLSAKEWITQPKFQGFIDGRGKWKWSTDQTLLNYFVKKAGMKVKHLDWRWNALYKGILDNKLSEAHFIHFFLKDHLPSKGEHIQEIIQKLL